MKRFVVVGAGVVGICCGIALLRRGFDVTLVDPLLPGAQASRGNAGGFAVSEVVPMAAPGALRRIPGWLADPLGPLFIDARHLPALGPFLWRFMKAARQREVRRIAAALAGLLGPAVDDSRKLVGEAGARHLWREKGALAVYRDSGMLNADRWRWDLRRRHGVAVEALDRAAIRDLEPSLSDEFSAGYFIPGWCHTVDPDALVESFHRLFAARGGRTVRGRAAGFDHRDGRPVAVCLDGGDRLAFDAVVIAAGAWSGALCALLGSKVPLESERGYNTTLPAPGVSLEREVIFAEHHFVATPMAMGLRIGGAAEFAGLERPPNYRRCDMLLDLASRCIPGLDSRNGDRWMGHRPTLPDSLPVIGRSPVPVNVFHAFGHGHLGLTLAATTGAAVARLAASEQPDVDLEPCSISRFH